jgi:hypothetical protein
MRPHPLSVVLFPLHLFLVISFASTPFVEAQPSITQATATLSQARWRFAAASSGSLVLFAGGKQGPTTPSAQVDIYNSATGTWTTATLSVARSDLAAAAFANLVFFAGGWNGNYASPSVVYSTVDIYNVSNQSWGTASLSQARGALAATSVGNFVLFAGGWNFAPSSSVTFNTVDMYNVPSNSWTTATLSQARSFLRATSIANRWAIFAGGQNESVSFNTVDIYDSSSGMWSVATLSQSRADLAATSFGNWAFFAGGDNGSETTVGSMISNVVDIFNSSSWSTATLSQSRTWLAAGSMGGMVLVGGGSPDGISGSATVDVYNPTSNSWSTLTLSQARFYLVSASLTNQVFFAGGATSGGLNATSYSNVVDIFSVSVPPPSPPPPPQSPKSSVAHCLQLGATLVILCLVVNGVRNLQ